MDERFLMLLTKIVLLLILFPLCQYGSEFKLGSFALYPVASPRLPPEASPRLPVDEVSALQNFRTGLEIMGELRISESFCSQLSSSSNTSCSLFNQSVWHITGIVMENARLTGKISASVAKLEYLEKLDLSNNKLHGSIPEELGRLTKLQILDLSGNQLTGRIPGSLGNLKNLQTLYLKLNFLNGMIPQSLGSLSSLIELSLASNQLSGSIPHELGDLSQLQILELNDNGLTGSLPPHLGDLRNLQQLWLSSNNLNGALPNDYNKLANLQAFEISGNNFTGSIPEYIPNWVNLYDLNLMGNNFNGTLPPRIFNMKSLQYLLVTDLDNSGFSFPESANLESLFSLTLRNCNIIGKIPPYIANWSSTLGHLDLSFNKLNDSVPDQFKNLKLYTLFLTGNNLSGPFPDWIYGIVQTNGDLSYNEFTFRDDQLNNHMNSSNQTTNIEPRHKNFTKEYMDKHCPHKKSKYYSLFINAGGEKITIGKNHYEADTSTSRFNVSDTNKWAYSCNGDFTATTTNSSDFIKNATCGVSLNTEESPLLANSRLCPQSLTYYGFCFHNGDYIVKLHFSEIVYAQDEDHSSSGKRLFDIYIQRNLEKKDFNIKERAKCGLNNKSSIDFTANVKDHLLEIELYWAGKGSTINPPGLHGPLISAISVTPNFKVGGLSTLEIVGIVIGAVSSLLLSLALLLALSWRLGWLGDRELLVNTVELNGKPYTLKQVKDATLNFSSHNVIGEGRFGIVYKAELPEKMTVAVKKLSPQSKQEIRQIGAEVYALKKLNENDNVVKLLDCYSGKDLHLLIYEYMEKGSLQQALFDPDSDVKLDWPKRSKICHGIAKGLKYLHEYKSCEFVHRNIKPSNILLDGDFNAKVADFGLTKLYDEENPYKFIQEKGTAVYMAPEYWIREAITDKVDVYSFGIVLLETVSGRTNAKYVENQETDFLLDRAIVLHAAGRHFELVDTKMPIDRDVREQAIEVLKLAIKCVNQSPTLRPTMSEIVSELEKISNVNTRSG